MKTESVLSNAVALEAKQRFNSLLWRNNVGALPNPKTGVPVRFGLGNVSPQINKIWKSSDFVGIVPRACPNGCGWVAGILVAAEIKKPGWKFNPNNPHEKAQLNFINTVRQYHGFAGFVSSLEEFYNVYR